MGAARVRVWADGDWGGYGPAYMVRIEELLPNGETQIRTVSVHRTITEARRAAERLAADLKLPFQRPR